MKIFEELIEYTEKDEKIVKSFETKKSLSPYIFKKINDKYVMKSDIRDRLLEITNNFIDFLSVDFFIHDIVLTGSLSNYSWSDYSDVDIHIIIDFDKIGDMEMNNSTILQDIIKEFFLSKKDIWNKNHDIKIKNYEVEVYVQNIDDPHMSSGVYSILNNEWIITPTIGDANIDDRKILEKGDEFMKLIDKLIANKNNESTLSKIEHLRKKIKKFRQSGLEYGGEYSYENLTFKLLRRNGYIGKLLKLKTDIVNKKLSITQ
jgi:hypothetical protein